MAQDIKYVTGVSGDETEVYVSEKSMPVKSADNHKKSDLVETVKVKDLEAHGLGELKIGEFVAGVYGRKWYIGKVEDKDEKDYEINFMKSNNETDV